jgi:basic amino acid/polyamine antiporter, APA family
LAAVLAAACLTLEYGVSGAAVARTWGDKVLHWLHFSTDIVVNWPACFLSTACTALLLSGVQESKRVMNLVTLAKMMVVLFMIIGGLSLYDPGRLDGIPATPSGPSGVLRGATTSFFGYLGYDEVCCVAGEAKHPGRDMPRAVMATLLTVTVCYILAAIALTGMLPYTDISPDAGFPDAFAQRDWKFAAQLTAAGEVATLPVVVVISLMAQPRLTLSMAVDGLLPAVFKNVDESGNLWGGTLISGIVMTVTATFIPFASLDDLISAGILIAFCMTNSCLVLLRTESPVHHEGLLEKCLAVYNVLCFATAMVWTHSWAGMIPFQRLFAITLTLLTAATLLYMAKTCPHSLHFGGSILRDSMTLRRYADAHVINQSPGDTKTIVFQTPWVPYLPCIGMAVNWYLIAQLDWKGVLMLFLYLGLTTFVYLLGCAPYSVGHNRNWNAHGSYETVSSDLRHNDTENDHVPDRASLSCARANSL